MTNIKQESWEEETYPKWLMDFREEVEEYCRNLQWGDDKGSDERKTLVIGNIRTFAEHFVEEIAANRMLWARMKEWEKEWHEAGNDPLVWPDSLRLIEWKLQEGRQAAAEEEREAILEIIEESEWECPQHGKEFQLIPPLCRECNQCLEVNIILANVGASVRSRQPNQ